MLNYWWVSRPKRKLNSIPEVLSAFSMISLDQEWRGQRNIHLMFEDSLEKNYLKREGERRDQSGSGARTYQAWIESLGLIFVQESTSKIKLTLAGEAIMEGQPPVSILKNQVLRYQFPSSYSIKRNVNVSSRFRIRPFRFLLRLLNETGVDFLTQEEIAKIIIVEATDESDKCFNYIVNRIIEFRNSGDACLDKDFDTLYGPGKGAINPDRRFNHLLDISNTLVNWIEYTQLVKRNERGEIRILDDKLDEVRSIISINPPFIDRQENHEYYQRKYGLDPKHYKDTRNLSLSQTITAKLILEMQIKREFLSEALRSPISSITINLSEKISNKIGVETNVIYAILQELYPFGAIGAFMSEYFEMAFKGRDEATEFEHATAEIFKEVFKFQTRRIGSNKLNPDIYILSKTDNFIGIIDNKAYSKYSISNDHRNRMIHNYIQTYKKDKHPLAFFSYIAGGFGSNINAQIQSIYDETSVHGSAISVSNVIRLVERYNQKPYSHAEIRSLFSSDRQIILSDI